MTAPNTHRNKQACIHTNKISQSTNSYNSMQQFTTAAAKSNTNLTVPIAFCNHNKQIQLQLLITSLWNSQCRPTFKQVSTCAVVYALLATTTYCNDYYYSLQHYLQRILLGWPIQTIVLLQLPTYQHGSCQQRLPPSQRVNKMKHSNHCFGSQYKLTTTTAFYFYTQYNLQPTGKE